MLTCKPATRIGLIGVVPVDVAATVHRVRMVGYIRAFWDEDGGGAVWAAAARENGIFEGFAGVGRHDRIEALGFVEDGTEVLHVFELGVGGHFVVANVLGDFATEAGHDSGGARELPEDV